jgi:hypothetical protein
MPEIQSAWQFPHCGFKNTDRSRSAWSCGRCGPDLQKLVALAGSYPQTTKAQWAEFDREMAEYHERRRHR